MAVWRLDGKPRTARPFRVYKNGPWPPPEERLFCLLTYLKTYSLQGVQGRLFGMGQSKANQWLHVLLPARLAALRTRGAAPARSLAALAQRLGVSEADAASGVGSLEEEPASGVAVPVATPESPRWPMTGPNDALSAPKPLLNRPRVIAARKRPTPSKMSLGVQALLLILFLSDTFGGRSPDKPIADAMPYPWPAGRRLWQDLGFLAFTLPDVAILLPTKKPRGQELTREQQRANQALHQRRRRIEPVNSSVKRCRIVKDRLRLWKQGVRDLVMELCCALPHFRVRLTPWQPMV